MLSINCICCAFGPGSIASRGLLLGAEAASRNPRLEWDAVSPWSPRRKLHPRIGAQNGMRFPVEPLAESVSRNLASNRDMLSGPAFNRKLHPILSLHSGTRFPLAWPLGKHVPDWQDATRQVAVQQPLQLYLVEPCRQRGLPDACRLQLFRERACRTDFVHGKAQQGMTVKR